jgi:hypothetical protein
MNQPERWAKHSSPYTVAAKNKWSYISAPKFFLNVSRNNYINTDAIKLHCKTAFSDTVTMNDEVVGIQ